MFFTFLLYALGLQLKTIGAGWVDADTPDSALTTTSLIDGATFQLVMSDEFEMEGRRFDDGYDSRWTALNRNDYTNAALHYYAKDLVSTSGGMLNITTTNEDVEFEYWDDSARGLKTMNKTYRSGMVQSWNKFCFTGGIIEVSASLPGEAYIGGLWPAIWLMGNLARATFTSSSDFTWPWSYNECDTSDERHRDFQYQQEISACNGINHYGMQPFKGRGAPEIDLLEVMPGQDSYNPDIVGKPYASTSFQVSPSFSEYRPVLGSYPDAGKWYEDGIEYGQNTSQNLYFFGSKLEHDPDVRSYWTDAISANHALELTHFADQHIYRLEWESGDNGYLRWYIDDMLTFGIQQDSFKSSHAVIPVEPMYILLNTAVSTMWGFPSPCPVSTCSCDCFDARNPDCACALPEGMDSIFPAHFFIDYVRVYQNPADSNHTVGCSPSDMPSSKWIQGHADWYKDPGDATYLMDVQQGGAACTESAECGGGRCAAGRCICSSEFTGPECRAPAGYDDTTPSDLTTLPSPPTPYFPTVFIAVTLALVTIFVGTVLMHVSHRKRDKRYAVLDEDAGTKLFIPPVSPFSTQIELNDELTR